MVPDDPTQQTSSDSKELDVSPQEITAEELSSIIDAVPKLSLESKGKFSNLLSIDHIINELKLLNEREEKARKNSATSTKFDKI